MYRLDAGKNGVSACAEPPRLSVAGKTVCDRHECVHFASLTNITSLAWHGSRTYGTRDEVHVEGMSRPAEASTDLPEIGRSDVILIWLHSMLPRDFVIYLYILPSLALNRRHGNPILTYQ